MTDHCTSCGKPFVEHDGIIRTCARALRLEEELRRQMKGHQRLAAGCVESVVPSVRGWHAKQAALIEKVLI